MLRALIICLSLLGPSVGTEQYMKFYNIVCEANPKYVENATCELNVIGRQVVVANMEMEAKNALKNLTVHFQLFKFYNQFRPFLINVTFNVCDIVYKKVPSNFYSNLVIRTISKFSNSQEKCSIEKV